MLEEVKLEKYISLFFSKKFKLVNSAFGHEHKLLSL